MDQVCFQGGQLVHTGTGLMVVASVVCVIAAVTNDRYFPEARMSQKEAKVALAFCFKFVYQFYI